MTSEHSDFRKSARGRKQSWLGYKKHVKHFLSLRLPHAVMRTALRLRPALANGRLPAPARLAEVIGKVDGATFRMVAPDRCVVAKELYWGKGHRPRSNDAFALLVFVRLARSSDVIFDIGAYTGIFTLSACAAKPSIRAFAFEIVPEVHEVLEENLRNNGFADRVDAELLGVGAPDTVIRVPLQFSGSALPDFLSSEMAFTDGIEVRFRTLDSFAQSLGDAKTVCIKIDVEGTEVEIFRHGAEFLRQFRPDILCELLPGAKDADEVQSLLASLDYHFYRVEDHSLNRLERVQGHSIYRDWLFTTRSPSDLAAFGIEVMGS